MKNKLFAALLCVFVFTSGCGGKSGVPVDSSSPSTDADVTDNGSSGDGDVDNPTPADAGEGELTDGPIGSTDVDPGLNLDDPVIVDSLPAPVNLSSFRYSATAGELFWEAPEEASSDTLYRIERDGNVLATVATLSYFTDALTAEIAHTLSVYVVDGRGHRSAAASITLNDQIDVPPPVYEFELVLDRTRAVLEEGGDTGAAFVIDVAPQGDEPVELTLQGQQADDGNSIQVSLGRQVLSRDDSQTSVTFHMSVGMRPIQSQERRFNLVATSGDQVRSAEIILDVMPTSAPDVYLLIGQSNMVGNSRSGAKEIFAGGKDERNGRIWQLNVAPNNNGIFSGSEDFVNEASNAIEPRFIEAEDPLHDPRNPVVEFKGGTTVGLGLSFAKAALADTTQRIYLVPAAWGASGFCNVAGELLAWNAGASGNSALGGSGLLERALTRLRMTMRDTGGVLRGVLWHQGGADSNSQACADAYEQNLQLMVERIRRDAPRDVRGSGARGSQAPIPFIVATQSKGNDDRGDYSLWPSTKFRVDAVHRNISAILPYADWVNNDDLVPSAYPCGSSSCVHFGAAANRETGRRFYEALSRIWNR